MGKTYRSVWCRCLATLLMAVVLCINLGYMPEAKAATTIAYPVKPLKKTSGFIPNRYITWTGGSSSWSHLATDYSASSGQAIYSIADGIVYDKGYTDDAGYYVVIKHEINGKTAWSRYQHFSKAAIVSKNEEVKAGQQIGTAGKTGNASGVHLHIQIFTGSYPKYVAYKNTNFSSYEQNKEYAGPITINGTTFYDPHRVITGSQVIGNPDYENLDSTLRIGISTKPASGEDQCYVKEQPFEDSNDKSASVPEGNAVRIVGAVENKYGNTWYKTADGGYVYNGDVTVWEYSKLFSLSANFQTKKSQNSHLAPYVDSGKANSYPTGTVFEVKTFVTNSYGNIWAELADGTYLNFCDKNSDVQNIYFMSHVTQPTITDATKPTGNRNVGASFVMKGIIKAQVPFVSVSCRIIDRQTGTDAAGPGTPITVKPGVGTRSVDISKTVNGVNIDTSTKFGKLTKGWYRYEINAQFGFTYNGKTFNFGSEQNFVSSEFTVGNPGTLTEEAPPAGDEEPPAGDVSGRIPGDVNENGSFEPLDALRMLKWLAGWDVTINESNADVNGNGSADPLDGLRMLKALAGWDVVLQ